MNVSGVNSTTATSSYTTSSTQESQDQFLQLLVTQIQNQNPLDPMSNEEFTSQLTQFSMLEQLEQMNSNFAADMGISQSLNNTMMLDIVGRTATVLGDGVDVADETATGSRLQSSGDGTATVEVHNSAGEVVATYLADVELGWNDIDWNGLTDNGEAAPDGTYTLSVTVVDRAGNDIGHEVYRQGHVDSIRFENNLAILSVAGDEYFASEIAEVGL